MLLIPGHVVYYVYYLVEYTGYTRVPGKNYKIKNYTRYLGRSMAIFFFCWLFDFLCKANDLSIF